MENSHDNYVKINYVFRFPVTDEVRKKVEDCHCPMVLGRNLNLALGKDLENFFRNYNSAFRGRFSVDKVNRYAEGVYGAEYVVTETAEDEGKDYLMELLKKFTGTDDVEAMINLDWFF